MLCAVWAAFALPARAQWICNITDSSNFGQSTSYYWYTALSCNGNNVVVAADVSGKDGYYLAFLLSTDGGTSWSVKDNGLPAPSSDHRPIITSIDQIDSLNIIAFGDSDLLAHTTDGGATWQELTSPSKNFIGSISFSDSMNGLLVTPETLGTYVTSDGGANWSPAHFTRLDDGPCRAYGNGKYRIFRVDNGVVYTTKNDWKTVDSTGPILSDSLLIHRYIITGCSFGTSDTMFAYGESFRGPFIVRSTNGGKQWNFVDTIPYWGWVQNLSDISRDTIIAGTRESIANTVIWSTDHGATWRVDTLLFHDSNFSAAGENFGIGFNSEGELLGAYSFKDAVDPVLILGQLATAGVNTPSCVGSIVELFPNPATASITLTGVAAGHSVHVLDILGREVLHGTVPATGPFTLDVSSLPSGLYYVSDGYSRAKFVKE